MPDDDKAAFTVAQGEWSPDESRYADRLLYKVGRITVGAVDHPIYSKGESRHSKATLYVPGIKLKAGTDLFDGEGADDKAKARVEAAFRTWLRWLALPTTNQGEKG